jgi:predicted dehydrogenase
MIHVGIVGAGYIGELHANIIHDRLENAQVVAVVDMVRDKGENLAHRLNTSYHPDLDSLLKMSELDVVAVCAPTSFHADIVVKAAREKKHIFCEKPLALSLDEADAMIQAVHANNVKAMCGHVLRFWPAYVKARELVLSGELGNPVFGYCERLLTIPDYTEGSWNRDENQGGGVAFDVQIHDLDYLSWVFDRPVTVRSSGMRRADYGGWLHIGTELEFANGGMGMVQAGWGFPKPFPFTAGFRIVCEGGVVEWSFRAGKLLEERQSESSLVVYNDDQSREVPFETRDAFLIEWEYFLHCLESDKKITNATLEDGKNAIHLALSTMKSASTGKTVEIVSNEWSKNVTE